MSTLLWRFYYEDDVDAFKRLLDGATVTGRAHTQKSAVSFGSPFAAATVSPGKPNVSPSPNHPFRGGITALSSSHTPPNFNDVVLSRADLNRRDAKGLTLLHHACSANTENAITFAMCLVAHPLIDLYVQDLENGWTALHRAFYFGNIAVARAIVERETQLSLAPTLASSSSPPALIRMKDKEGNGPYDLLAATIVDRTLHFGARRSSSANENSSDDEGEASARMTTDQEEDAGATESVYNNLDGDELYTFGSNRNLSLGFGDEDDRHFPERIHLKRPTRLYHHFWRRHIKHKVSEISRSSPEYAERVAAQLSGDLDLSRLPSAIRAKPIVIRDVQMAKFHTAVLTDDPFYNLHVCGHGLGGRLGTGNERTQFTFACLEDPAFANRRIVSVALGQDHSLAVTSGGEIFTWGSNAVGQLGIGQPKAGAAPEENIQPMPKQLFGPLKKESILGVAASRIHSVAHNGTALFTWGKNEGQLGLVDAHAGTLDIQPIPRRVAASRITSPIKSIVAIERATIVLLENHEVHVLANYGAVKLQFDLDSFGSNFLQQSWLATKYNDVANVVSKISGGGDTICAMSSAGEIYTVTVNQRLDPQASGMSSTTNPNKIRAALSKPMCAWSLRKEHMRARDVGVDEDGSVIICTSSGSVWRRVRRPKVGNANITGRGNQKAKDFKFVRVPNLTRAVAVRASASGAYSALRNDCDVLAQIEHAEESLENSLRKMHPLHHAVRKRGVSVLDSDVLARLRHEEADIDRYLFGHAVNEVMRSSDPEQSVRDLVRIMPKDYDMVIKSTLSDIEVPTHQAVLSGRSAVARQLLSSFRYGQPSATEYAQLTCKDNGQIVMIFQGVDILTLFEIALYVYTDKFVGFWNYTRRVPELAYRYRQVKTETSRLAAALELRNLESAVRRVVSAPTWCMDKDFELAFMDPKYFENADAIVQLSDGELPVHSVFMANRCPFFEGLFEGRAHGRWLSGRMDLQNDEDSMVEVDLKHIETSIFKLVLRHIYADTREELFDDVVSQSLEDFVDMVLEVLSVANELMLDDLSQACQAVLGRYANVRNACSLLNAVAPSSVSSFKDAALEYACLSLESLFCNHLLDELDEDILAELDAVVKDNQLAGLPFVRSGRAEAELHEKYPELATLIDRSRQAKLDSLDFASKSYTIDAFDAFAEDYASSFSHKKRSRSGATSNQTSPVMTAKGKDIDAHASIMSTSLGQPMQSLSLTEARSSINDRNKLPSMSPELGTKSPRIPNASPTLSPQTRPWESPVLSSTKLGMKEIMSQTSASRTSNLSLGLDAQARLADSVKNAPIKVSQKERKRQQQKQQEQTPTRATPERSQSIAIPTPSSSASKGSPWQTVSRPKTSVNQINAEASPLTRKASETQPRSVTTPQLTMRQTVANTPSKQDDSKPVEPIAPRRTVSTPQTPAKTSGQPAQPHPTPPSSSKGVEIQSVRHTPRPRQYEASPEFYMHQSLADIISEETAGKQAVKEATAKRNLQEIQQEQEFQEWWDNESRRVQEEAAKEAAKQQGKSSRNHAGRSRRRGKGKDAATEGKGKPSGAADAADGAKT